jgi:acyl-CoA synthetase (AMP-forming)/AMP-acid ligase II
VDFNVGDVHEAIAVSLGDRAALVHGAIRRSWSDLAVRSRQLANVLHSRGLGCHRERAELQPWQSGQDHLALYLHNGPEYLESMLGAFKARVAPFNVNYRCSTSELRHVLDDANCRAVVVHSALTPSLGAVIGDLARRPFVLQVRDQSNLPLLPGALWFDETVAAASEIDPPVGRSPDDLYLLYTGGTTGAPKGVMWRQADAFEACFGGSPTARSMADVVAAATTPVRLLVASPLMHGTGHWAAFGTWHAGGTVYLLPSVPSVGPAGLWTVVERERIGTLVIVGDAFAQPLIDELERHHYDIESLSAVLSGGACLSAKVKNQLVARQPTLLVVDGLGSSEAGGQLTHVSSHRAVSSGVFTAPPGNVVLSEHGDTVLPPGDPSVGWLAKSGAIALGYLGDPERTQRAYRMVEGVRYAVPGDRARLRADGLVEFQGRDDLVINTGGEKVFAEEVEAALKEHPSVRDCVVTGAPSPIWGTEVVAIVAFADGPPPEESELFATAARSLARYKLPKRFVVVDDVVRSPMGKVDYGWARALAARQESPSYDNA